MRITKRFAGIAALLAAAVPVFGAMNAGAADNYRHLGTLTVHETEDWGSGGDEPFIPSMARRCGTPAARWTSRRRPRSTSTSASDHRPRLRSRLGEQWGPHDLIGSFPVKGWGKVQLTNDDAHYTIDVQR